jgi:outer membrane biosynthesis protein TonB
MAASKAAWVLALLCWACLVVASTLPAVADEPTSCKSSNNGFLLGNGAVVSKPGTNFDPIFKTHTLVPYPAESQRRRERGIAIFLVSIGTDGAPTNVAITRSGASQRLTDGAIEHIKAHWRWPASMQECPQAVTVIWLEVYSAAFPEPDFHVKMPLSAYPPGAAEKVEDGSTLLEIETDGQGAVTGGRVIHTSGFSDLDDQSLAVVKNSPALLKGQPAGKHVLSADWHPPLEMFPAYGETVIVTGREPR